MLDMQESVNDIQAILGCGEEEARRRLLRHGTVQAAVNAFLDEGSGEAGSSRQGSSERQVPGPSDAASTSSEGSATSQSCFSIHRSLTAVIQFFFVSIPRLLFKAISILAGWAALGSLGSPAPKRVQDAKPASFESQTATKSSSPESYSALFRGKSSDDTQQLRQQLANYYAKLLKLSRKPFRRATPAIAVQRAPQSSSQFNGAVRSAFSESEALQQMSKTINWSFTETFSHHDQLIQLLIDRLAPDTLFDRMSITRRTDLLLSTRPALVVIVKNMAGLRTQDFFRFVIHII